MSINKMKNINNPGNAIISLQKKINFSKYKGSAWNRLQKNELTVWNFNQSFVIQSPCVSVGIKLIQTAFKRCQRRAQFHRRDRHIIPAAPPANWLSFNIISPLSRRGHGRSELFLGSPVHEKSQREESFCVPGVISCGLDDESSSGGRRSGRCIRGWRRVRLNRLAFSQKWLRRASASPLAIFRQPAYITFITRLKPKWVSGFVNKLFVLAEAAHLC